MQAWGVLGSSDRSTRSSTVLKSYTPGFGRLFTGQAKLCHIGPKTLCDGAMGRQNRPL